MNADTQTRPMFWSIRREMWENRSITMAPLIVSAIVLFGTFASLGFHLPRAGGEAARRALDKAFSVAPAPIMLTSFIVAFFYAIDALYSDRRDRSLLFWKSLPVSDRTAVLSKFSIPMLVLPSIALLFSIATQFILLLVTLPFAFATGANPLAVWAEHSLFPGLLIMIYGLVVHVLWFAPLYGWLMLLSAWARRLPLLWAVLLPFAIGVTEWTLFRTKLFLTFTGYRFIGAMNIAFRGQGKTGNVRALAQLDPIGFLTSPGLWLGLIFAALCLVAAIRLRRNREPI